MATSPRKKTALKSPIPLSLKGSKLEDFLPLLPAEAKLRQCAANGEACIVDDFSGERPENPTTENSIRAEYLRYMAIGGCSVSLIHARGINIVGAFITCNEELDLQATEICKDLKLHQCLIEGHLNISGANAKNISLNGSKLVSLIAEKASINGSINLEQKFTSQQSVRLSSAKISGSLLCENAELLEANNSLIANRAKIEGDVDLENVIAERFSGARSNMLMVR